MIKETGKVVKAQDGDIWVETQVTSSCNACAAKANCGTSSLSKAFSSKTIINKVQNHLDAKLDDVVEIGIPEESLIQGATYLYIVPLFAAMVLAFVAQSLNTSLALGEWFVIVSAIIGGWLGLKWVKFKLAKHEGEFEPQLLQIISTSIQVQVVTD